MQFEHLSVGFDEGLILQGECPFFWEILDEVDKLSIVEPEPSADNSKEVFNKRVQRIARNTFAAGPNGWDIVIEDIEEKGKQVGLTTDEIEASVSAAESVAELWPTAWILVARSFVFEAGKNRLVHVTSGEALCIEAFDMEFGCISPAPNQSFARFLCDRRYIMKVQAVVPVESATAEFYVERGRLYLRLPTSSWSDEATPLIYHLQD